MNEFLPPSLEEVAELTPERMTHAITALEAMTIPKEMEPAMQLTIASLKTLIEIPALLALYRLARRLGLVPGGTR